MTDIGLYLSIEPHMSNGMSVFQMDKFVIEDQLTPYRKLRQATMEARSRLENITSLGFDIEELEVRWAQAGDERDNAQNDLERKLGAIKVRRCRFELDRKHAVVAQQQKEVEFFLGVIDKIVRDDFGGADQLVQKLQDSEFHLEHETEFWVQKFSRSVFSDLVNYGTISKGVAEAISNLTSALQARVLENAQTQLLQTQKLMTATKDTALIEGD